MDKKPEIGDKVSFTIGGTDFWGEVIDYDLEDRTTAIVRLDPSDVFMEVKDLELDETKYGHMVPEFDTKMKDGLKKVMNTYVCGQCPGRKCTTTMLQYEGDEMDEISIPCRWVKKKMASFIHSG